MWILVPSIIKSGTLGKWLNGLILGRGIMIQRKCGVCPSCSHCSKQVKVCNCRVQWLLYLVIANEGRTSNPVETESDGDFREACSSMWQSLRKQSLSCTLVEAGTLLSRLLTLPSQCWWWNCHSNRNLHPLSRILALLQRDGLTCPSSKV